jgi:prephenate dehydrogenase
MKFDTIGFIGLGLIGGSIAKAIKHTYPTTRLIGMATRQSTLDMAYQEGVISNHTFLPLEEFAGCDVLFLCSPVKSNVDYLKKLKPMLPESCLLTDVGSVKGDISAAVEELGLSAQFIGGHPMAGAEATGFEHANANLLENAYYILTATAEMSTDTLEQFDAYIRSLGAITLNMSPVKHDFATACISHLPHVIAASLVNYVREADHDGTMKTIAAGGFRDITRIASSSPVMWQHICASNRDEILHALTLYEKSLEEFKEAILTSDEDKIRSLFADAKDYRDDLPVKQTGVLPSAYEFYLDLRDEAGGIATIATILAKRDLSIKNIGIVHNREFEQGVLRIEMYDAPSLKAAMELLQEHYIIHPR